MAEKKPIILLYFAKGKEAGYRLSKEKQKELMGKIGKNLEEVGGKTIVACDCRWANEEWAWFGVEEFPDIEAVQKHKDFQDKLEWYRYVEAKTYLGTRTQ